MFPEFGSLRKKPLITFRRKPLFREGQASFLPQEPPEGPQTRQYQSDNSIVDQYACSSTPHIRLHPFSSSSSATNSSTDKDDDEDDDDEEGDNDEEQQRKEGAKREVKENDIFAFPSEQSKEVKLMIVRVSDNPSATTSTPKKKSTSKPKQNKLQKQNKLKPKGKPAQTVNNQQKSKQLQQQQQQQQQQLQKRQPLQQKPSMTSYGNFDISTTYSPHLNAGYSNTYYNNTTTSSSFRAFNSRVTISSLLDAPPPIYPQPSPSTTINYHPILTNTSHSSPQFNTPLEQPEKKRKRNLVGQLKAASGETPENTNISKSYSDDEIDDECVEEPKPISTANALRSLSPELTYEARMEKQLSEIMKSEFGEGIKQEPQQELLVERKRYEPLNHRNVRVTFKRSQKQQQQQLESTTDDDIERVNQLISVIKSSQEK